MVLTSALVAAGILVALTVLVRLLEPRITFFPSPGIQETPASMSQPFVDLRIPTRDGETLHGWWLEHPQPRGHVMFLHGNGGNLSMWLDVIVALRRRGFSVLAVDYRGYGGSTGTATERGVYQDADAAVAELWRRPRAPGVPVVYWGRSLGSAVAAYAASVRRPDALVLETPMPDVRSLFRTNPVMWVLSLFASYRFPTARFVAAYDGPLLVVHGDRDSMIPFAAGRRVFEAAPGRHKRFAAIAGADHNDLDAVDPAAYWKAVDEFFATLPSARE